MDPPPAPEGNDAIHQELLAARHAAVLALMDAEDLERDLRKARRSAKAKMKHYENLLEEYGGQLKLELNEPEEGSQ